MRVSNSLAVRLVLLLLALALAACCCPPNDKTGGSSGGVFNSPSPASPGPAAPVAAPAAPAESVAPVEQPQVVTITNILGMYANNEVAADAAYKGKIIEVRGRVGDIKKDITDSVYITLGTGKDFEIPMIQAFVAQDQIQIAAGLNKGQTVSVIGRVDGLMMNVLMKECRIAQ